MNFGWKVVDEDEVPSAQTRTYKTRKCAITGSFIVDSDDDEHEKTIKESQKFDDTAISFKGSTPSHHHDMSPSALSPFCADEVEHVVAFPQKQPDEPDMSVRTFFATFIARTPEQCAAELAAPQRSLQWKEARKFALTASDFGSAAGDNPHNSPDALLKRKLWDTFSGNAATKWGSRSEPCAAEAFLQWAQTHLDSKAVLHEFGLLKWSSTPWLAVSPDGVLEWTDKQGIRHVDLVEFKCPTRTRTHSHPYGKYPHDTPPYYRDQMLGIWGLANANGGLLGQPLGDAWFVVWQPQTLWISKHTFQESDWSSLFQKLRQWYFVKFLPALVWWHNRQLPHGEISVPLVLNKTGGNSESTQGDLEHCNSDI